MVTVILWIWSLTLIFFSWVYYGVSGLLPLLVVGIGLIYSETRRFPLIPIILVSFTSTAPILFPIFLGYNVAALWYLFIGTVLIIFSREMVKDIEDMAIDHGYKWTLALHFNDRFYKWFLVGIFLMIGVIVISVYLQTIVIVIFFLPALFFSLFKRPPQAIKSAIDLGIVASLFFILSAK